MSVVTFDFSANTQNSAALTPRAGKGFNVSVSGTFVATIGLYRQLPGDLVSTWRLVNSFTAPTETAVLDYESGTQYRLSCTAYTSGTASGRLGQSV